MKSSLVFIIPYFGRWPFWMPYFLRSCAMNPDINWLLYSDCGEPAHLPANVRYQSYTYEDYCALVSQRLGVEFKPQNPYKLCDLKPALGQVHEEDIKGFDFWGFSDLDLIYGDLRAHFTEDRLSRYDLFSTHERRVSGHLCLMRNTEEMRKVYLKAPTYLKRLCDQKHHGLDEGSFSRVFIKRKNFPDFLFKLVAIFNPWRRRSLFVELFSTPNAGRAWIDGSYTFPTTWFWRDGVITTDATADKMFPYFHFLSWKHGWKNHPLLSESEAADVARSHDWSISKDGFYLSSNAVE